MKIYCQKCGSGAEYKIEKPNFCQSCGNGFNPSKVTASKTVVNRPKPITHQQDEEEESDISLESIQSMSSLDVEISPTPDRKVKMQDLMGTKSNSYVPDNTQNSSPINKEEMMESFKREAGFYPVNRKTINEEE